MPKGQFYALAIFLMDRLDTKGVGLKPWGRPRACSQDYPMALDPLLNGSRSLFMIFFFLFRFKYQNNHDCIQICDSMNSRIYPLRLKYMWDKQYMLLPHTGVGGHGQKLIDIMRKSNYIREKRQ